MKVIGAFDYSTNRGRGLWVKVITDIRGGYVNPTIVVRPARLSEETSPEGLTCIDFKACCKGLKKDGVEIKLESLKRAGK
jgi:hypothetical protein